MWAICAPTAEGAERLQLMMVDGWKCCNSLVVVFQINFPLCWSFQLVCLIVCWIFIQEVSIGIEPRNETAVFDERNCFSRKEHNFLSFQSGTEIKQPTRLQVYMCACGISYASLMQTPQQFQYQRVSLEYNLSVLASLLLVIALVPQSWFCILTWL